MGHYISLILLARGKSLETSDSEVQKRSRWKRVEMAHEWTGPIEWPGSKNVKSDGRSSDLISDYKPAPLPFAF